MTEETPEPTLEERVTSLETTATQLASSLDSALTANEVLQIRYSELVEKLALLVADPETTP